MADKYVKQSELAYPDVPDMASVTVIADSNQYANFYYDPNTAVNLPNPFDLDNIIDTDISNYNNTTKPLGKGSTPRFFVGTCDTAANTAAKVVTCQEYDTLTAGDVIFVKFTNTNSAAVGNITLNVNGSGAKGVKVRYNGDATYNGTIYANMIAANQTVMFTYDGNGWILMTPMLYNSQYSTAGLGNAFGVCTTAAATAAKTVSATNYAINNFGYVTVAFQYAVPANATLNVNSKGAKSISYFASNSATTPSPIAANIIPAGSIATFVYVGVIGSFGSGTYILIDLKTSPISASGGSSVSLSTGGSASTTYYIMGTTSTIGTTLYRYGTSGPYMTGADLFAGSDLMYKKDIKGITDDFIENLFAKEDITYNFKWKDSDKNTSGFIAQYIEDIMPEMVDGVEGEKHVNYNAALSKVVGALFKKIKQQQKEIDEIKELLKNK